MSLDGENVVEKEDALFLPVCKIASGVVMEADVGVDFFINIDERRWDFFGAGNGKGKTVGGTRGMIGVLAEDDYGDLIEVGGEGAKDLRLGGKDGLILIFCS